MLTNSSSNRTPLLFKFPQSNSEATLSLIAVTQCFFIKSELGNHLIVNLSLN